MAREGGDAADASGDDRTKAVSGDARGTKASSPLVTSTPEFSCCNDRDA